MSKLGWVSMRFISKTKSVTPQFFCISDRGNSLSDCNQTMTKICVVDLFRANVLKRSLRGSDCKYRESADRLEKSKILITCQKNTFGELSSKILLKLPGTPLFSRNAQKTKIPVFPN